VAGARGDLRTGGTTDYLETRGKKKAEGIVDGYKRPVLARYHKEGTDPHHKMPTRNGNLRGDKESDNKAETSKDSGGGIKTHTAGPNNLTGMQDGDRAR
jgi:hypothetical protein